jgi:hypothetical protein
VDFLDFMGELDRRLQTQPMVEPRFRRRRHSGGRRRPSSSA